MTGAQAAKLLLPCSSTLRTGEGARRGELSDSNEEQVQEKRDKISPQSRQLLQSGKVVLNRGPELPQSLGAVGGEAFQVGAGFGV